MPKPNELTPAPGSRKTRTRVGRGIGSGLGKTSGKGHKGQKARAGGGKGPGFEGGQMPLQMRLPKHGFTNIWMTQFAEINVGDLNKFEANQIITPDFLHETNTLKSLRDGVKVLGSGTLEKPLIVKAHKFTKSAISKIEAAGGKAEVV